MQKERRAAAEELGAFRAQKEPKTGQGKARGPQPQGGGEGPHEHPDLLVDHFAAAVLEHGP